MCIYAKQSSIRQRRIKIQTGQVRAKALFSKIIVPSVPIISEAQSSTKFTHDWRRTFYTRSNGEVIGAAAAQNQIFLPLNINALIRSTCVMMSHRNDVTQSGFWVGPRLFISTLHFHTWIGGGLLKSICRGMRNFF